MSITIHREGYSTIIITLLLCAGLGIGCYVFQRHLGFHWMFAAVFYTFLLVLFAVIVWFFRMPTRQFTYNEQGIMCPADGRVVIIQTVEEPEYFKDKRQQISVFMSPLNIHVNRYPISGIVRFFRYHEGKYLVAWHPKSSVLNERTTVVIDTPEGNTLLVRQIAGAVARRIVCYANTEDSVQQNQELGFIKFGSRVDIFLPLSAKIKVKVDDVVFGGQTVIAEWGD